MPNEGFFCGNSYKNINVSYTKKKNCLQFRIYFLSFFLMQCFSAVSANSYNNGKSIHVFKVSLDDYVSDI